MTMKKAIAKIREEAIARITTLLNKYGTDTLELDDFSPCESPIVHDNSDGNHIYTLDRVELTLDGNLSFDSSSSWANTTDLARDLDTDTLVGIAGWLEEREKSIAEAYTEPETKSSLESDEIYVCDSHGNLGVQKVDWR